MNEIPNEPPPLGPSALEEKVGLVKAALNVVPFAGGVISEIIGTFIPQKRFERLENYARYLNSRLEKVDEGALRKIQTDHSATDLFEDGAHQAARALSDERRQRIAYVVANGLMGDEAVRLEAKRILNLLGEIDDDQIIILLSHTNKYGDQAFFDKHATVLAPVGAGMGSSQEELDKDVMQEVASDQLVRLGLLRRRYSIPRKGQMPEFDDRTGTIKTRGVDVTSLGRLFLTRIGLLESGDL